MVLITVPGLPKKPQFNKDRRPPDVVLGIPDPGASPRGNTYWKTLRGCPREHALRNIVGLKREGDQEALTVGLAFHYALEVYYKCIQAHQHALGTTAARPDIATPDYFWGATSNAEKMAWRAIHPMSVEPGYEDTYEELERLLASYFDCYRRADKWRIIAVEETLEYTDAGIQGRYAVSPMEYSARLDLIVEDYEHGGMWVVEHKCLTGDARLRDMNTGKMMTLKEMAEQKIAPRVHAWKAQPDAYTSFGPYGGQIPPMKQGWIDEAQATVPEPTGIRDVFEVTTKHGRRVRCSSNHPFMTARGWVAAENLTSDDWLMVQQGHPDYVLLDEWDFIEEELRFVGMMLGDGTLSSMRWSKCRGPVFDRFVACLDAMKSAFSVTEDQERCPTVNVSKRSAAGELLKRLGLHGLGLTAAHKAVPTELMSLWDERQVKWLLAGLWDTDGCIDVFHETRNGSTQTKVRCAYVTRSEQLATDVQSLLLRLSIPSSVQRRSVAYKGERRPVYTVQVVTRPGKRRFLNRVGAACVRWSEAHLTTVYEEIKPGNDTPIPVDFVREHLAALPARTYRARGKKSITVDMLEQLCIIQPDESAFHEDLPMVFWDRVDTVLVTGREQMYNLEVPEYHNFVVNDIVTHNTARSFTEDLIEGYQLDQQIVGQVWLLHRCVDLEQYPLLKGVKINLTSKTKIPKHQRVDVCPSKRHVAAFEESIRSWNAVAGAFEAQGWPKALGNCSGPAHYFKKCEFFDVCHGWPDVSVAQFVRREPPLGFIKEEK